jgi:hypothetical protein
MWVPQPGGQPDQTSTVDSSTKWISISAGGNDVGFKDIGYACAKVAALGFARRVPRAPKANCQQQVAAGVHELNTNLRERLRTLYTSLLQKSRSAVLAVVGYPRVFPADYGRALKLRNKSRFCVTNRSPNLSVGVLGLPVRVPIGKVTVGVQVDDARSIDKYIIRGLNRQASGLVRELRADPNYANRIYYADTYNRDDVVPQNCTGHTPGVTVNGVRLSPPGHGTGPLGLIGHATFHPTKAGQQEMAQAVQDAFDQAPAPIRPVPSTGPTLVYQGGGAGSASNGDFSFSDWSSATGESIDTQDTLPRDPYSYRCLVLDANRAFNDGDQALLSRYLKAGGTIVALGEHAGSGFDEADTALNSMASALGANIALDDNEIDASDSVTTNIDPGPLTNNVASLGYNWASTLTLGGSASPVVESADGSGTLVASQVVENGTFVMAGDTNAFSDANSGAYTSYDNGQLVKNICP